MSPWPSQPTRPSQLRLLSVLVPAALTLAGCSSCADSGLAQARQGLQDALAQGDVQRVSDAARAASTWQDKDPALDRALGDALANVLLRPQEGAALLKANPAPEDPAWVDAALDAALRSSDRVWMGQLYAAQGLDLDLDTPAMDQLIRLSKSDRDIHHALVESVVRDCMLVDQQPRLGLRQVDLPVTASLRRALDLLGATHVVVARTVLQLSPRSTHDRAWQCHTGWLPEGELDQVPDPLPPRGVLLAATDGQTVGFINIDMTPQGPWAQSSPDPAMVARWLRAGALLDELGADPQAADKLRARFGAGLAAPPSSPAAPPSSPAAPPSSPAAPPSSPAAPPAGADAN